MPSWIPISVYASSGFFLLVLFVAAVFAPSLRVLHLFQGLIYVAVMVLVRRNSAWGFGAGSFTAAFWNYIFLRGLAPAIWAFVMGRDMRPDIGLQLAATLAHCVLIIACLAGFLRQRPDWKGWARFLSAGFAAIAYVVVLIVTMRPQMIPVLRMCFGL